MCAKTVGARDIDIDKADDIELRTIELIEFLNSKFHIFESPQIGKLKDQLMMYDFPHVDVDPCNYGLPYRKRTRPWNSALEFKNDLYVRNIVIARLVMSIIYREQYATLRTTTNTANWLIPSMLHAITHELANA